MPFRPIVGTRRMITSTTRTRTRRPKNKLLKFKYSGPAGNYRTRKGGDFDLITAKSPFKPYYKCVMQYCDNIILTAGTAGLYGTELVMRLNSLYSPQFSGPGASHQPYGFDQMAALYRRCIVHAVDIELIFSDPSEDGMNIAVALQGANGTYSLTSQSNNELMEKPQIITRAINNSGSQIVRVNQYTKLHKLEGISKIQWKCNLADYSHAVGGNPTLSPYLRIAACSIRNTSAATIMLRPKIRYFCTFYERIIQEQS